MTPSRLPGHLAIIMDGNGRWAQARGHNRFFGHVRGARVAKTVIEECARIRLKHLTLFAFSNENWFRPPEEVSFLMSLLERKLRHERNLLVEQNICFRAIGDLKRLPEFVQAEVTKTVAVTKDNSGMVLTFALSYSGRQELVQMARELAAQAKSGKIDIYDINESLVSENLSSSFLPEPDLILRTSGECRLSNFFLWQSAYSEIFFEETAWPDFTLEHLRNALDRFAHRERRFGRTGEQLEALPPT